jgi:PleD family two-component response regulator
VPSAAISLEHLLARADASVYQAKRDGRNRVVLHNVA